MAQQQHSEDSWDVENGTVDDVKEAVVANLEHRGVMRKLRAKVKKTASEGKIGSHAPHPYMHDICMRRIDGRPLRAYFWVFFFVVSLASFVFSVSV